MYILLDHTRTALITIVDGCLPGNTGGGSNIWNILRRVFAICDNNGWWEKLGGIDGLLEIIELHKLDLKGIFGEFKEYKSFDSIIKMEYDWYKNTDTAQRNTLEKQLKKQKGTLSINDWIVAMQSWGIPADTISKLSGIPVPNDLYKEIADWAERQPKASEVVLYDTTMHQETWNLYYDNHHLYKFEAKI